ncbi:hypothetical protein PMI18_04613 [Pseudomonas sp. GM102]|nr:hypothetical protein PMI18_04613 [Pseudomonas sp. GM102]
MGDWIGLKDITYLKMVFHWLSLHCISAIDYSQYVLNMRSIGGEYAVPVILHKIREIAHSMNSPERYAS